ncbi:MAG: low temperature requirement protein A, partial [Nocardioidaceae bacterium]|nr:low temperature requirement protein A [Nocardioidaceae bacterium]
MTEDAVVEDRGETVEWLELFFDLVVVAAVAVLTEGLREDPTPGGLGLFVVLYVAIWLSWVSVVLYANVARDRTRVSPVVYSMFLVAVMAASAPGHFERRANLFAAAFLLVRAVAARGSLSTGRILTSWPLLQLGGLATPWIVAMWVEAPAKYGLWALGLGVDLFFVLVRGEQPAMEKMQRLRDRMTGRRDRGRRPVPELEVVGVEEEHLDERLGLFMIIVLGEAVSQLVVAASTRPWTPELLRPGVLGFVMLVGLWWLTFSYGFTAAPHTRLAQMPPRFALPMHLATTLGVVCLAAGLGEMVFHPDEELHGLLRWVMCGGVALHFLVTGIGGVAARAPYRWVFGWALPCTLVPLLVASLELGNGPTTLSLLACVAWMV